MGIPSCYKRLVETYKGLVAAALFAPASHLHLDFNCAIYHCVQKLQRDTPYTHETRAEWEAALCDRVVAYIDTLVAFVAPTKALHICIDGVVPMNKMRQQRQRRFKGAYLRALTMKIAADIGHPVKPQWDTNAITPGTAFMATLAAKIRAALPALRARVPLVTLSDADEPGEGEHKVLATIRAMTAAGTHGADDMHVVYGLDADLIMLSLLQTADGRRMALVREAVEFGKIKLSVDNKETLVYFDIMRLAGLLCAEMRGNGAERQPASAKPADNTFALDADLIRDYVFLCSLLGNDFVPHGFSLAIHDDGMERVIDLYTRAAAKHAGARLVTLSACPARGESNVLSGAEHVTGGAYNPDMLAAIIQLAGVREAGWLRQWRGRRATLRPNPRDADDALEYELNKLEEWPTQPDQMRVELAWPLPHMSTASAGAACGVAAANEPKSHAYYYEKLLGFADSGAVCRMYIKSLVWVLAYYSGACVDARTYYPFNLPPLWSTLASGTCAEPARLAAVLRELTMEVHAVAPNFVTPAQQCALVFPMQSYALVPAAYRNIPRRFPEYFPTGFAFFTPGRRFLWQCEPLIPMLEPGLIDGGALE